MQVLIIIIFSAFLFAAAIGNPLINCINKKNRGKVINALGPKSHIVKQGTPEMGGFIFITPTVTITLLSGCLLKMTGDLIFVMLSSLVFGLIGFADDYIKASKHSAVGLTRRQKLILQISVTTALLIWSQAGLGTPSCVRLPFFKAEVDLGWFYFPVMLFVVVNMITGTNWLDGLDGLLAGCSIPSFAAIVVLFFMILDRVNLAGGTCVISAALAGSLLGFLLFNRHPARIFMGDTGSFFIGGILVGIMIKERLLLFMPMLAFWVFFTWITEMMQFAYFRLTGGKRIFRMVPFHHHLELGGMPETRIVMLYRLVSFLTCLLALLSAI